MRRGNRLNRLRTPREVEKAEVYCNSTYDGYLCWPPTLGGQLSVQHCPDVRLSDATQFAFRRCGVNGRWAGRHINDTNPNGWTNYTPCFPPVVQSLFYKVYDEDESQAQTKFQIADITRIIEIIGFTISFISLTVALIILNKFRSLNNVRTRIHKNLFTAMNAQVILRLIVYIDQAIMRRGEGTNSYTGQSLIEQLPYLCVTTYIVLEYFVTVMFMWMLCEGMYLNTIVTNNVLRADNSYKRYCLLGWLLPVVFTTGWATLAGVHYANGNGFSGCWYGYNFHTNFWVMQGPRVAVIGVNFVFLLNIMYVLVRKLRVDTTSDIAKTRKAVKAAMVLLPLLGITNVLNMFEGPVEGPVWHFATWSYTTHFLRSFQGAVLAWLYCLATTEIITILRKSSHNRAAIFRYRHPVLSRYLGLQRNIRIRRFPRNLPGRQLMAQEFEMGMLEAAKKPNQHLPTRAEDTTETEFKEPGTAAEIHKPPSQHVYFCSHVRVHEFVVEEDEDRRRRKVYEPPKTS